MTDTQQPAPETKDPKPEAPPPIPTDEKQEKSQDPQATPDEKNGGSKEESSADVSDKDKRYQGDISQWFTQHQTGFVSSPGLEKDITVHFNSLRGSVARLRIGDKVDFRLEENRGGRPQVKSLSKPSTKLAEDVVVIDAPKRERINGICASWNQSRRTGVLTSNDYKSGRENIHCVATEIIQKTDGDKPKRTKILKKENNSSASSANSGIIQNLTMPIMELRSGESVEFEVEIDSQGRPQAYNIKRKIQDLKDRKLRLKFPTWITDQCNTTTCTILAVMPKVASEDKIRVLLPSPPMKNLKLDTVSEPYSATAELTFNSHEEARQAQARLNTMYMTGIKIECTLVPTK
eukprot:jgi/Bigna1/128837/aug1.7_g3545